MLTFTRLLLLSLTIPLVAQTDWEGRKKEKRNNINSCEAGFTLMPRFTARANGEGVDLPYYDHVCVPTKQLIESLVDKLAEAARVIRETRTSVFNMEEKLERMAVIVDILEQENNHLHAKINALTPKKDKK